MLATTSSSLKDRSSARRTSSEAAKVVKNPTPVISLLTTTVASSCSRRIDKMASSPSRRACITFRSKAQRHHFAEHFPYLLHREGVVRLASILRPGLVQWHSENSE